MECQEKAYSLEKDPRVQRAGSLLQWAWNLGYDMPEIVKHLCGKIPPLADFECQWLAIWFPWTWRQIREVFPEFELAELPEDAFFHA